MLVKDITKNYIKNQMYYKDFLNFSNNHFSMYPEKYIITGGFVKRF
jgi:hypothetical protein